NYHHLRYFHEVAREGHLGRTAEKLNVSQSALSIQLRQLEDRLGHKLFDRVGRGLELTEVGAIAKIYADSIFQLGRELQSTLARSKSASSPLRVGAASTLSRNFQIAFLRPLLSQPTTAIELRSGSVEQLLNRLVSLELDVVLATELPPKGFEAVSVAQQEVGLHGHAHRLKHASLTELLNAEPLILPTDRAIRPQLDALFTRLEVAPRILAEVDDMAMIRLLAREDAGIAVAPSVVLADEIASGRLQSAPFPLAIAEPFYAVTIPRRFPHPMLDMLLERSVD
ncbi:MAG: LysR family transcriptional regulator, partial [Pseudomonadota bacterium]